MSDKVGEVKVSFQEALENSGVLRIFLFIKRTFFRPMED